AAQVDQVLVTLGPVAEEAEFLGNGALRLGGRRLHREHGLVHGRRQRTPCGVSSSRMPSPDSWWRMASARAKSRACFAALRSSTRAWMRAASAPSVPLLPNHAAGACC